MNSYRQGLRSGVFVNLKLFILEKVNFGPHTKSNLVKLSQLGQTCYNLFYLVRVITQHLGDTIKGLFLVLGPFLLLMFGLASWAYAPIISNPSRNQISPFSLVFLVYCISIKYYTT